MTTIKIRYEATNEYDHPVTDALYEFLIFPDHTDSQQVMDYSVSTSPGLLPFYTRNHFGFKQLMLRCSAPFTEMTLCMEATVLKWRPEWQLPNGLDGKTVADAYADPSFRIDQHWYLSHSRLTKIEAECVRLFPPLTDAPDLVDYLCLLNSEVFSMLVYRPGITNTETTACEVMALRSGVCQDFAHVLIGLCRQNGIPARYVSGYLKELDSNRGGWQMHAWVECLLPDGTWIGMDPTNDCLADDRYIKVAHGCDYSDCSPLRGIIRTSGTHTTRHSVSVKESDSHPYWNSRMLQGEQ